MRDEIFKSLNDHVNVSHETYEKLIAYHDLLIKWQAKINLVGTDTISDIWQRHFLDSLQLIKYLPDLSKKMVDLGTGAGFPGMILAIAGATDIHLVESDGKKITFLNEVARITHTKVFIHHSRIESSNVGVADIILSRACSPLEKLFSLSLNFVSHGTICLFHKGKNHTKELEDAQVDWLFDQTIFPSVTDSQGVILKLGKLRKRAYDSEKHSE